MSASVKVAVRVRPFNQREKDMNSFRCIGMSGPTTTIVNPETKEEKQFTFDYSYWSHDGYHEEKDGLLVADNDRYATQQKVFDDLGKSVLDSAMEGYNATLFAYGQTGSGKSFSMVGYGVNRGIVPMVCEEMFRIIRANNEEKDPSRKKKFQVTATMLEIYNEVIKDLLNPAVNTPGGLKVRSKPGVGVYVENLTPVAVSSYQEIERRMDEGTANRTIGATKMNATSSRAHTVFGINFTQIESHEGQNHEMTAHMNLVDLAGSERADSTGATGDRLKEGCAINASLSALGNVISALADIASGKKKVFVPYRNSALTRLLQDALGGNSKTIMCAALSPADVNYDETLSTLRYADRAKKIKNNVIKNENPTDKIIRMLKEENARLMAMISGKGPVPGAPGMDGHNTEGYEEMKSKIESEAKAKLEEQMAENNRILEEMKKTWEEKLKESAAVQTSMNDTGAVSAKSQEAMKSPYIININEDQQLSECLVYMFKKGGTTRIGKASAETKQDIIVAGLNIMNEHAIVTSSDDMKSVTIEPLNKSKTFVDGDLITVPTELHSGDRLILGNNFVFRFMNPLEPIPDSLDSKYLKIDEAFTAAMDEFSTKQGLRIQGSVGGEMGKLEQEEAAKRKELEDKLAKMEAEMMKEREAAKQRLEQQKLILMKNGDVSKLSDEEKKQLAALEEGYETKQRNLEEEIAKRKELSEKMLQEQMKRKRQTKKIEEKLAKLMPCINEANLMSEELHKGLRFEARLAVKSTNVNLSQLDELRNLKTIDVTIRVTSGDNGNQWTWNHAKFDSRLYMMREMYQEYLDKGGKIESATAASKSKDPFWDPPEPMEIGKSYVYLKALSQLVEIESEFAIVDYKGDEQGMLEVNIYPEGPDGEDMDYLQDSSELVGKTVVFNVKIPSAKNLPLKYGNDVYVTFSFNGQSAETEAHVLRTANPDWNFSQKFKIENITEEMRQYLLKDAAVFEVRGFTDSQNEELKANAAAVTSAKNVEKEEQKMLENEANNTDGSSESGVSSTSVSLGPNPMCGQCEEKEAMWECSDCSKDFCEPCFALMHKAAKKAQHSKIALHAAPHLAANGHSSASVSVPQCQQCDEKAAQFNCSECGKVYCPDCNTLMHKSPKKSDHFRSEISSESFHSNATAPIAPPPPKCEQCDEHPASVKCSECDMVMCDGCNALLHKAAKKAGHNRTNLH